MCCASMALTPAVLVVAPEGTSTEMRNSPCPEKDCCDTLYIDKYCTRSYFFTVK